MVEPIKPTLKAPGIRLLKLKYDGPLSHVAFKFKLRRYDKAVPGEVQDDESATCDADVALSLTTPGMCDLKVGTGRHCSPRRRVQTGIC